MQKIKLLNHSIKLHLCTLTFTLIITLTLSFRKYGAIPSHNKKTYAQIPSPPYSRSEKTEIPLNATVVKICAICFRSYSQIQPNNV